MPCTSPLLSSLGQRKLYKLPNGSQGCVNSNIKLAGESREPAGVREAFIGLAEMAHADNREGIWGIQSRLASRGEMKGAW